MKVGLVGCGAIGREVAVSIDKEIPGVSLSVIYDIQREKASELLEILKRKPQVASSLLEVAERCDFIVEAASSSVVKELLEIALEKKRDVLIMSIGGVLAHLDLIEKIEKEGRCRVFFPSGAIAGVDGLIAAREKEIYSVCLTTFKHPKAIADAPYVLENKIDLDEVKKPTVIFEGTSREAVKAFPRNINISATLSLAGIGMEKTKVKIIADPAIVKNIHKIQIKGVFGEIEVVVKNVPSHLNPRTSYLAALSAVATLKKIASFVKIGT